MSSVNSGWRRKTNILLIRRYYKEAKTRAKNKAATRKKEGYWNIKTKRIVLERMENVYGEKGVLKEEKDNREVIVDKSNKITLVGKKTKTYLRIMVKWRVKGTVEGKRN